MSSYYDTLMNTPIPRREDQIKKRIDARSRKKTRGRGQQVVQLTKKLEEIITYPSIVVAENQTGISVFRIKKAMKTGQMLNGYKWMKRKDFDKMNQKVED